MLVIKPRQKPDQPRQEPSLAGIIGPLMLLYNNVAELRHFLGMGAAPESLPE
jgi:hypothetical protein